MTNEQLNQLGKTLWDVAYKLRGAMNADDFHDYPQSIAGDRRAPLAIWYDNNANDIADFEKQMRLKTHYVIEPPFLWSSIAEMARTHSDDLLITLDKRFNYIEEWSFGRNFQRLFSEINLYSEN